MMLCLSEDNPYKSREPKESKKRSCRGYYKEECIDCNGIYTCKESPYFDKTYLKCDVCGVEIGENNCGMARSLNGCLPYYICKECNKTYTFKSNSSLRHLEIVRIDNGLPLWRDKE